MVIEIILAIVLGVGILSFGLGLPALIWITSKKIWYPEFLRPNGRIEDFPGIRFEGRFSAEEVNEGIQVFRKLWIKHEGGSLEFASMFNFLDIRFTDRVIVTKYRGEDMLANGIADSRYRIRVNDRSTRVLRDENGGFIKESGQYASAPIDKDKIKISRTALGHELIHIGLWWTKNEPDHNHDKPAPDAWLEVHNTIEKEWHIIMKEKGL